MQQWRDDAIILTHSKHGEQAAVVHILTEHQGRTAGYLRAANSARHRPLLQTGNVVSAHWQSRLPDQLGYLTLEPVQPLATLLMQRADWALALQALSQILLLALPERQCFPDIYTDTKTLLENMGTVPDWAQTYVWWEVHLLSALGFGLRLESCVQTDQRSDLTHVSPKSGHAACRAVAAPFADRLLKLPHFLGGEDDLGDGEVAAGLALTGFFLQQYIAQPQNKALPDARLRLAAGLTQTRKNDGRQRTA